ncbi:MAG: hypothetical protein HN742_38955 [Lentisphaerae bacterium]|jgi:hypothetical protein|nr:hypothetical protein [Lentisphaerota bacterium]MBT4821874.1 hypothetical protein [Lentisphaerota bacterium]MBT5608561.1 hypothetical protein [Lentisphaerota bacterium]MBT7062102.1 hypothetical protein [Lentisphaerota bacterium]MBT7847911.1 hypothetical protein [Lentisphaerota bacterium]
MIRCAPSLRRSVWTLTALLMLLVTVAQGQNQTLFTFADALSDPALPGWRCGWGNRQPPVTVDTVPGPNGKPALRVRSSERINAKAVRALPAEELRGKTVLVSVWRKADGVVTGEKHYHNAKTMVMWKGKSEERVSNPGTIYTDFQGTTEWEHHRYIVAFPEDLVQASVHIGLELCSGTAAFADLEIKTTTTYTNNRELEIALAAERARQFAGLAAADVTPVFAPGRAPQLHWRGRCLPWRYWNDAVLTRLVSEAPVPSAAAVNASPSYPRALAQALLNRADELERALLRLASLDARRFRAQEIAGLRYRAQELVTTPAHERQIVSVNSSTRIPVPPLLFGNNINAEHLSAVYDPSAARFSSAFSERVDPMQFTFMRYPGGCNADVFNWKDTIGPIAQRGNFINYHNADDRGPAVFGVDDFLRWCEQRNMVPILTTAFLEDTPGNLDPANLRNAAKTKYMADYLAAAPERIALAADWVEYCNGPITTRWGALRAKNGHPAPYNVTYWELGNETWGADRVGSTTADVYAKAFLPYAKAMKARDPSITILLNGSGHLPDWNDAILPIAGRHADAFQIHIYHAPGAFHRLGGADRYDLPVNLRLQKLHDRLQAEPSELNMAMRHAEKDRKTFADIAAMMRKHIGRELPVFVTEYGMGNARDKQVMTSLTSAVLVADMLRVFLETPLVAGANKWALYGGYWFSQLAGPTTRNRNTPYYIRPEQIMHTIYARCRSDYRFAVPSQEDDRIVAAAFDHGDSIRIVLVNRTSEGWVPLTLETSTAVAGKAEAMLLTACHPLLGNEQDRALIREIPFEFDYTPGRPLSVPANSVMGLVLPHHP